MAKSARVEVKDQDILGAMREFFEAVLKQDDIRAILVPLRLPMKNMIMPTLVTDPDQLEGVDPLSPAFPINSAKVVSRLTRKPSGAKMAVVMRPCEIRAFVELVKLKQGHPDDIVIIGIDCLGARSNRDYAGWVGEDSEASTRKFAAEVLAANGSSAAGGDLAPACRICEQPVPRGADIAVGLFGVDTGAQIHLAAQSPAGEDFLGKLPLKASEESPGRRKTIEKLIAERTAARDDMFKQTHEATDSLEKLTRYLASCVNCYNCRVACPVCYCRECVFVTDVFDHEPAQYLRWAEKKGAVKVPTDTVFYHLTRMAHMSTACVGCGQCSNACPNDIPVMELFRTVAHQTQQAFGYDPGRSIDDKPPLSVFREDEFKEIVGIGT